MHALIGRISLAAALTFVPAIAAAQHSMENPSHEFGADIAFAYEKFGSGGGHLFAIATPVDLRIGFLTGQKLVVEPRITFTYLSGGGSTLYSFAPDLNFLIAFQDNKKGAYLTAGAGIDLLHGSSSGGGSNTVSQISFNGGIGTRAPYESGAIRLEAFVKYSLENSGDALPSVLAIGGRIGLSLWH